MALRPRHPSRRPAPKPFSKRDVRRLHTVVDRRPRPGAGEWTKDAVARVEASLSPVKARRILEEKARNPQMDKARHAKNVAPAVATTQEGVVAQQKWARNPRRMDLEGIDSPYGAATVGTPTESKEAVLRNVYGVMKQNLQAQGIPENEIAFIHDAKTNEQRSRLFDKVKNGDVRVIIGSTGKLGTGVNVQRRAAALHHLDAPWRPRDIEQREGRVIRQGNIIYGPQKDAQGKIVNPGPGVGVYTYVTGRSFDAYMWQAIEAKSRAIKSIMRRQALGRSIEDIDDFTMSAGEAKAVASGNPDVMKAVTLRNDVNRLQMLRGSHMDSTVRAREQLATLPGRIKTLESSIERMQMDNLLLAPTDTYAFNVRGVNYSERPKAAEALRDAVLLTPPVSDPRDAVPVGRYKGFGIKTLNLGPLVGYKFLLENPATQYVYETSAIPQTDISVAGVMQRVDNKLNSIPASIKQAQTRLEEAQTNLKTYQSQVSKPFEQQGRLEALQAELSDVEHRLQETPIAVPA